MRWVTIVGGVMALGACGSKDVPADDIASTKEAVHPLVALVDGLVTEVCACKTVTCADGVAERGMREMREAAQSGAWPAPTPEVEASVAALEARGAQCKQALTGGEQTLISAPTAGSPEHLVRQAIAAAQTAETDAGWPAFRALLHSKHLATKDDEMQMRALSFEALHRKVAQFTPDDAKPDYLLKETTTDAEGVMVLKIVSERASRFPAVWRAAKDPAAGGAWRLTAVP